MCVKKHCLFLYSFALFVFAHTGCDARERERGCFFLKLEEEVFVVSVLDKVLEIEIKILSIILLLCLLGFRSPFYLILSYYNSLTHSTYLINHLSIFISLICFNILILFFTTNINSKTHKKLKTKKKKKKTKNKKQKRKYISVMKIMLLLLDSPPQHTSHHCQRRRFPSFFWPSKFRSWSHPLLLLVIVVILFKIKRFVFIYLL